MVGFRPNVEWATADLLTGVTELRNNFKLTGRGVKIGIIDTGELAVWRSESAITVVFCFGLEGWFSVGGELEEQLQADWQGSQDWHH
jgi:hypothetical protein